MRTRDRSAPFDGGRTIALVSVALALVGVVGLAVGAFVDPVQFFYAYLTAFAFVASILVGALLFLMTCHAMRASWPVALQRLTETVVGALPILPVLFVPLLFGMSTLYPWMHPERIADVHERHLVEHKAPYLNPSFFVVRSAIYFAIWIACGTLLRRWSIQKERTATFEVGSKPYALSGGALPAVGLALAFASFDWTMSLTPTWFSTMYPVYWFGGGFLGAIALLTVLSFGATRADYLPLSGSHFYALGRLLLAFTIFWAYAAYFQLMLIWIANKPIEGSFYAVRWHGNWRAVSAVLGIAKFVVPFFVLLNYRIKWRPGLLSAMAAWILVAHWIDMHHLVAPAARAAGPPYHWLDPCALLAVGGLTVAFATWRLRGLALLPINDPALPEALRYRSA